MPCESQSFSSINFFSGAFVAIVAAGAGHLFAAWRERENRKHIAEIARKDRKRNFIGLLSGVRLESERMIGNKYAEIFPKRLYEVRAESAKVRDDIDATARPIFDGAIRTLCQLTGSQVAEVGNGSDLIGQRRVTEAIDAIVATLS